MPTTTQQAMEVLTDFLSTRPDRTALSNDCVDTVRAALGVEVSQATVRRVALRLGVTTRTGSLPRRPFVTYWSLPVEHDTNLTEADVSTAHQLVEAIRSGDAAGVASVLDSDRLPQVAVVLASALRGTPQDTTAPGTATNTPETSEGRDGAAEAGR